ncbi:MAG: metallophosphoesterase [Clostridia bacterium]|nr:metallophosphoesterase [Clostridia bacterium]
MTYVVSDLHGHLEEFRSLLEIIDFKENEDILYVLGDIVDYGPDPIGLINDLSVRVNVYPIAGEHDFTAYKMLVGYEKMLKTGKKDPDFVGDMTDWISDGGQPTMDAYRQLDDDAREGVRDYLSDMPLYEEVTVKGKEYLLLHEGIYDFTPNLELDELEPDDFFSEAIDPTAHYFDDKIIIAGHTPVTEENGGDARIFYGNNTILIDGGLAEGGRLACLRLEDGREFYV